jgi:hypothetical protein
MSSNVEVSQKEAASRMTQTGLFPTGFNKPESGSREVHCNISNLLPGERMSQRIFSTVTAENTSNPKCYCVFGFCNIWKMYVV